MQVSKIMVEVPRGFFSTSLSIHRGGVGEENVHEAIVVIIKDGHTVTGRLKNVALAVCITRDIDRSQTRISRDIAKINGYRRRRTHWGLRKQTNRKQQTHNQTNKNTSNKSQQHRFHILRQQRRRSTTLSQCIKARLHAGFQRSTIKTSSPGNLFRIAPNMRPSDHFGATKRSFSFLK